MRDKELIQQKGKGRSTYYVPGPKFLDDSTPVRDHSAPVDETRSKSNIRDITPPGMRDSAPVRDDSAPVVLREELPEDVKAFLDVIGSRASKEQMNLFLLSACRWKDMKLQEMANLLDREPKYILRKYIQPLMEEGKLQYNIPDMPNHPRQAYTVTDAGRKYLKPDE